MKMHNFKRYLQILIKLSCSWFDVFNSQKLWNKKGKKAKCAYGEHLELQNSILEKFSHAIENLICEGHTKMIDFQYGILTSSAALPMLYDELLIEYKAEF